MIKNFLYSLFGKLKQNHSLGKSEAHLNFFTGHLVTTEKLKGLIKEIDPADLKYYEPVPENLILATRKKLAGKQESKISLRSGGKLSRWASRMRRKNR